MAVLFSLREYGTTFATRGRGAEVRTALLEDAGEEKAVVIDFADVTHISYSFADEFVGKLSARDAHGPRIDLINMSEPIDRTVSAARDRRSASPVA